MILDLDYRTKVKSSIYGLAKYLGIDADIYTSDPEAIIGFELQPEAREWGFKYIHIQINRIASSVEWEVYADDLSDKEKEHLINNGATEFANGMIGAIIELDITNTSDWVIENDVEFESDGGYCMGSVEIDFETKVITIN